MKRYGINDMEKLAGADPYPGRGIVVGAAERSGEAVTAYFIMGRSANSRNRVLKLAGGDLITEPFDEGRVEDPSLIIYTAMRKAGNDLIVTNGDQTDTIYEALTAGGSFEEALAGRDFEPDFPNMTPRISALVSFDPGGFSYRMSIIKSMNAGGSRTCRYFFNYEAEPGLGHFIHTYAGDGDPLPSFQGEPERVAIDEDIDRFTDGLWRGLDRSNKIALYVRYTDPETGAYRDRMRQARRG